MTNAAQQHAIHELEVACEQAPALLRVMLRVGELRPVAASV